MANQICPFCAETIKAKAIKCRYCQSILPEPTFRKWYRAREGRMIFGVCQGLSHYLELPVTLIRLMFVIATFVGGWGIFLYLCLCLVPGSPNSSLHKTAKQNPISKLLNRVLFIILTLSLYLPLTLGLLTFFTIVIWGFGYPIFSIDIFQLSLVDLGPPGVILGISLVLLLAYLICLLLQLVINLHFAGKIKIIRGNKLLHLANCICLAMIFISSFSILIIQYNKPVQKTWVQKIAVAKNKVQLNNAQAHWFSKGIPLRAVKIKTAAQKHIEVVYTITARGMITSQVNNALEKVKLEWPKIGWFPKIENIPQTFFTEQAIEIICPENLDLQLSMDPPAPIKISGKFLHVSLSNSSRDFDIHQSQIEKLTVSLTSGNLKIAKCNIKKLHVRTIRAQINSYLSNFSEVTIDNESGNFYLRSCKNKQWKIYNKSGDIFLRDCTGALEVEDENGFLDIKSHNFLKESNHFVKTDAGKIKLSLNRDTLPHLLIKQQTGYVHNRIHQYEPNYSAKINIFVGDGTLWLNSSRRKKFHLQRK